MLWETGKRVSKFDFSFIEIDQTVLFPWGDAIHNFKMNTALSSYMQRSKRKFKKLPKPQGLEITRLS